MSYPRSQTPAGGRPRDGSYTIVLGDDHVMVREALARVLEGDGRFTVVGQADHGGEVVEIVTAVCPDCLILDYSMPRLDAPQVISILLDRLPRLKILVLTVHQNYHYAAKALETSAHGYLIKSAAFNELVRAIETVSRGQLYVSEALSDDVFAHLRRRKKDRGGVDSLSPREFDLLRILATGTRLQDCARRMQISTSTASTYRSRVLEKLGLETTADLIRFAIENKLAD